jgi:hypothetical protein
MLESNQITLTLQGQAYRNVQRLLRERETLVGEINEFKRTARSGTPHPKSEQLAEVNKQLIYVLGSAALDKIFA